MKIHLPWIRMTAAAVVVAGVGVHQAAAQYAPYRPIPPQPAATVPAQAPYTPYTAYQPTASAYGSPTGAQYAQPSAAYPQYPQYPQTVAQYPAYGAYPRVAQAQPTEVMPAPQKNTSAARPSMTTTPAPAGTTTVMPSGDATVSGGYMPGQPGCGCNGANYGAGDYYQASGVGSCTGPGYPDCGLSNYFNEGCSENQWFGGVYFLEMARTRPSDVQLAVRVDHATAPNPYYPKKSADIISTDDIDTSFQPGVEVRLGSTFTIGDACCQNAYGGCNSCGCAAPTTYAWEVAWWGIEDDSNTFVRSDDINSQVRIYGMKNFNGLEYDRDGSGGAYNPRPVNYYYGYNIPIPTPPAPSGNSGPDGGTYLAVLGQRAYNDFKCQDLELNIIRFPACEVCASGCGVNGCGGCDPCGCNGGCGCGAPAAFAMYGSCGVRYFHIDDTFAYDTEFAEWVPGAPGSFDKGSFTKFGFDNSNELCYDVDINNNLIGPQMGWTNNYCCGKWNLFLNSTFGIFENHMDQVQRMWSGGGGTITFQGTGQSFNVSSHKDDVAFLGELRAGVAYDVTCHWRAVAAYRAIAMTGIATSTGQIPDNFSSRAEVAQINSDNSMVVHGVQVGAECRY